MEMESVKCNLCQSDDAAYVCHFNSYRCVRCLRCGLYYINPRPTKGALAAHYDSYYDQEQRLGEVDWQELETKLREAKAQWEWGDRDFFVDILTRCKQLRPKGRVLDVGCGYGFFLRAMRENGYSVCGVELSKPAASYASRQLGIEVFQGDLREARFPNAAFDIVSMNGVLEHLDDPLGALLEVNRISATEGIFTTTVPNATFGLPFVVIHKLLRGERIEIDTRGLTMFGAPNHIFFFTKRTLCLLLARAGFDVLYAANAVPIRNPSRIKTLSKGLLKWLSDIVAFASGGSIMVSHSLTVFAQKKA